MQTLFDLATYHIEPAPDPSMPSVEECLQALIDAEIEQDAEYLESFQHWLFFKGARIFSEADYQRIFQSREQAAEALKARKGKAFS